MENNRVNQKLFIYLSNALLGAFLAGAATLNDDTLAKMTTFKWCVFGAGCLSAMFNAWRAFIDKSTANEDKKAYEKDTPSN